MQRRKASAGTALPTRRTLSTTVVGASRHVQKTQAETSQAGSKRKREEVEPEMIWINDDTVWIM
jgi:hypothetical protein